MDALRLEFPCCRDWACSSVLHLTKLDASQICVAYDFESLVSCFPRRERRFHCTGSWWFLLPNSSGKGVAREEADGADGK